jgi:hypothetical protein
MGVVPETDARMTVEEFAVALEEPLDPRDIADGWSEEARLASVVAVRRVLADLDRGWGEDADYSSRHLLRALDHWGIAAEAEGRLSRSAEAAQSALIRLRPAAQHDGSTPH